MMALHVNIRDIAHEKGVRSARALAERTGLSYETMIRYWQGGQMERVNLATLATIARVLGTKAKDLLVETPDE
jgi:DNA-binding Xre family transcriptional regulator